MSLIKAILALEEEIAQLAKMPEGSSGWFLRQAKSFGLSLMKRANQKGLDDPIAFDQHRQRLRRDLMQEPVE